MTQPINIRGWESKSSWAKMRCCCKQWWVQLVFLEDIWLLLFSSLLLAFLRRLQFSSTNEARLKRNYLMRIGQWPVTGQKAVNILEILGKPPVFLHRAWIFLKSLPIRLCLCCYFSRCRLLQSYRHVTGFCIFQTVLISPLMPSTLATTLSYFQLDSHSPFRIEP